MQTTKGQKTWIKYGEPINDKRVETTVIKHGEEIKGAISYETVDLIEDHEHQHDDGSLLMSYLDMDEFNKIKDDFTKRSDLL